MRPSEDGRSFQWRCLQCDEWNPNAATFCQKCGHHLTEDEMRYFASLSVPPPHSEFQFTPLNHTFVAVMVIATGFAIIYRVVEGRGLTTTYATFIGLPLMVGMMTAYMVRAKSGLGMTFKVTTILLCVVSPLLGEGAVCILMAAPIFYGVAALGYLIIAFVVRMFGPRAGPRVMSIAILPFLIGELSRATGTIGVSSQVTACRSIFVAAHADDVWKKLLHFKTVSNDLPFFLRLGFPRPILIERNPRGDTRLTFDPGSEAWPGTNVIESKQVLDASQHRLTYVIRKDGTKLARWLTFYRTSFVIESCEGGCILRQSTTFRPRLQPGLYWRPIQRFAMGQMHRYALENIKQLAEESRSTSLTVFDGDDD